MSVVEQALDKMRRTEPGAFSTEVVARPAPATKLDPAPIAEVVAPAPVPTATGPLLTIDRNALRELGYLPDTTKDRQFADYYRKIKRPLIAKALEPAQNQACDARVIMMASALPGDGKTFTSINLALSMARERDISVLLVDADVAKPHISNLLGLRERPGLLEALTEEVTDVESLVLATDVGGLSVLPAGKPHEGATELIASERMSRIVERLLARDPRRILLFDLPPLLVSSESRALVSLAGQLVLVIRAGKTPRHAVLDAIAQAGEGKDVRLVLNQGHVAISDGYYAYGYGAYGDDSASRD